MHRFSSSNRFFATWFFVPGDCHIVTIIFDHTKHCKLALDLYLSEFGRQFVILKSSTKKKQVKTLGPDQIEIPIVKSMKQNWSEDCLGEAMMSAAEYTAMARKLLYVY